MLDHHGHMRRNPLRRGNLPGDQPRQVKSLEWCEEFGGVEEFRVFEPGSVEVPHENTSADAFERLVLPEVELLLRVAITLTRNTADAEDLVQDTLVRAYRSIDRFDGAHTRSWLLTILRNTHINRNRKRRPELLREPENQNLVPAAAAEAPDAGVDAMFDGEIVRALNSLPELFRTIIEMVDINGLSYAEASEALGVPVGTVMSRLHRGRSRMRDALQHSGLAPRSHP
jgi:RNA polymerase sigma-70 factor (ECF subfamily)